MKKSEILFGVIRLPVDFIAIFGAFWLAYHLRPITDLIPGVQYDFGIELLPAVNEYLQFGGIASVVLILFFAAWHLYSLKVNHKLSEELFRIVFLVSAWLMFIIAYYALVIHQLFFSRIALAHIWLFTILFVVLGRILIQWIQTFLLRYGIGQRRVLLIGANSLSDQFYQSIAKNRSYKIVGAVENEIKSRKKGGVKIIGTIDNVESIIKKYQIEEVIQANANLNEKSASDLHTFCRNNQIKFHFIPDLVRLQRTNVTVQMIDNIPMVSLKETSLDGWGHVFKRAFDIVASFILILLMIPFWILIAIAIKIDSRGPIVYKSKRKYRDKVFCVYKFRSMIKNADDLRKELLKQNERKGPLFKIKKDPRITRVGNILRKTSLDETPQLLNVLFGSMSLVGPRPHLPEEIEKYEAHHHRVFAIKPGVTGLAQVSGRSNLDFEEEVKLDVYYIENWSVWMDIKLILKSVLVVLKANGH